MFRTYLIGHKEAVRADKTRQAMKSNDCYVSTSKKDFEINTASILLPGFRRWLVWNIWTRPHIWEC